MKLLLKKISDHQQGRGHDLLLIADRNGEVRNRSYFSRFLIVNGIIFSFKLLLSFKLHFNGHGMGRNIPTY